MTTEITISLQEYREHIEQETRDSILYAFFINGTLNPEILAAIKGWKPKDYKRINTGYME